VLEHTSSLAGNKHHIKGQVKHTSPLAESKLDHIKGQVKHTSSAAECKVYHIKG
jgi:hypothetical protein